MYAFHFFLTAFILRCGCNDELPVPTFSEEEPGDVIGSDQYDISDSPMLSENSESLLVREIYTTFSSENLCSNFRLAEAEEGSGERPAGTLNSKDTVLSQECDDRECARVSPITGSVIEWLETACTLNEGVEAWDKTQAYTHERDPVFGNAVPDCLAAHEDRNHCAQMVRDAKSTADKERDFIAENGDFKADMEYQTYCSSFESQSELPGDLQLDCSHSSEYGELGHLIEKADLVPLAPTALDQEQGRAPEILELPDELCDRDGKSDDNHMEAIEEIAAVESSADDHESSHSTEEDAGAGSWFSYVTNAQIELYGDLLNFITYKELKDKKLVEADLEMKYLLVMLRALNLGKSLYKRCRRVAAEDGTNEMDEPASVSRDKATSEGILSNGRLFLAKIGSDRTFLQQSIDMGHIRDCVAGKLDIVFTTLRFSSIFYDKPHVNYVRIRATNRDPVKVEERDRLWREIEKRELRARLQQFLMASIISLLRGKLTVMVKRTMCDLILSDKGNILLAGQRKSAAFDKIEEEILDLNTIVRIKRMVFPVSRRSLKRKEITMIQSLTNIGNLMSKMCPNEHAKRKGKKKTLRFLIVIYDFSDRAKPLSKVQARKLLERNSRLRMRRRKNAEVIPIEMLRDRHQIECYRDSRKSFRWRSVADKNESGKK